MHHEMKSKVDAYVLAAIASAGAENIDKAAIVKVFVENGVGQSTVFRWIGELIAIPDQSLNKQPSAITEL